MPERRRLIQCLPRAQIELPSPIELNRDRVWALQIDPKLDPTMPRRRSTYTEKPLEPAMIPGASNASGDRIRHSRETRLAPDQAPAGGVRGGLRAAAHPPSTVDVIAALHLPASEQENSPRGELTWPRSCSCITLNSRRPDVFWLCICSKRAGSIVLRSWMAGS